MGSELAFTDSLLVSGHRAQATVLAAGLITGIANLALIASASLGGIAPGFLVSGAVASGVFACLSGMRHPADLTIGTILALGTVILVASVSRLRRATPAPSVRFKTTKTVESASQGRRTLSLAVLSGFAYAAAAALAQFGTSGELGVAPYAGLVFIALPALLITLAVTFFLFNFPFQGASVRASSYLGTRMVQHGIGLLTGVIWGAGVLCCFLVRSAPVEESIVRQVALYSALGSFALASAWGLSLIPKPRRTRQGTMAAAAGLLAVAIYFLSFAVTN